MQKISSILPSSPRVKSVDLSDSHPIRPGTPSFGRPVGNSTDTSVVDKVTLSNQALGAGVEAELLTYKNPREAKNAKIADELSAQFFETRLNPVDSKPLAEKAAELSQEVPVKGKTKNIELEQPTSTPMIEFKDAAL